MACSGYPKFAPSSARACLSTPSTRPVVSATPPRDPTRPRAEGNDNYREEVLRGGDTHSSRLGRLLRHGRALETRGFDGRRGVREYRRREAREELIRTFSAVVRSYESVELRDRVVEV